MKFKNFLSDVEFYSNIHNSTEIYAEYEVCAKRGGFSKKCFTSIDSPLFASYLRMVEIPKMTEEISDKKIVQQIRDFCVTFGNEDKVSPKVRIAGSLINDCIEYDLANALQEYVKVEPGSWKIMPQSKHKFIKKSSTGTQIAPKATERSLMDILKPYVNTDEDGLILFSVWLAQSFCQGNHSALLVMAEKGSGKTTLTKQIRKILDPSSLGVSSLPGKSDDFVTLLTNAYLVTFDNLNELTKAESDILCSAVTGATVSKRLLFQTNELGVFELHNALVLNGIDIIPSESDLAERCILLNLKKISSSNRRLDSEIQAKFEADLPEILGAIFTSLSNAMYFRKVVKPAKMPRMADSYVEMLSIALALGIDEERFEKIYFSNIEKIDRERSNIVIVEAVKEYLFSERCTGRKFGGKASDVYTVIRNNYSGNKYNFPNSASHFSRKLRTEYAAFHAVGITVNIDDTKTDATRIEFIKNK